MTKYVALALISVIWVGFASTAWAQSGDENLERLYADYYGDGLRFYAEARYPSAVENLFRAYALKPSPMVMALIVRSYDFMGHCDAAARQRALFEDVYPRDRTPRLQRCEQPGTLVVECEPFGAPVIINGSIEAQCGAEIALADGRYRLQTSTAEQTLDLQKGTRRVARLEGDQEAPLGRVGASGPGKAARSERPKIPRLPAGSSSYTVFRSEDGLYQIWVNSDLRDDPDMAGLSSFHTTPRVEIVCSEDGDPEDRGCMLIKKLQQSASGYTDDPRRYEVLVPKVP